MQFRNVELYNFGRYAGNVLFDTTVTGDRNVILVQAKNDRGKTTLFQAIKFALYGNDGLYPKSSSDWINLQAASEDDGEMYVELKFEHEGKNYKIRRVSKFKKTEKGENITTVGNPDIELFENDNPHMAGDSQSNKESWIDTILPKDASQFFFFDGEEIQKYIQKEETHVRQAIEKVLGIKELFNAREDLGEVLTRFEADYSKNLRKNTKDGKLKDELQRKEDELANLNEDISAQEKFMGGAIRTKEESEKELAKHSEIKTMVNERKDAETELIKQQKNLIQAEKDLSNKRANLGLVLLSPLLKILDAAKEDPPTKDRWESDAATYILNNLDKCVCDHHIDENMRKTLQSKILDLKPTKSAIVKTSANKMLIDHTPALKHQELIQELENKSDLLQSIDSQQSTFNNLNKKIHDNSGGEGDVERLEEKYEAAVKDIGVSEKKIDGFRRSKNELEQQKKNLESRISSSIVNQELTSSMQKTG